MNAVAITQIIIFAIEALLFLTAIPCFWRIIKKKAKGYDFIHVAVACVGATTAVNMSYRFWDGIYPFAPEVTAGLIVGNIVRIAAFLFLMHVLYREDRL